MNMSSMSSTSWLRMAGGVLFCAVAADVACADADDADAAGGDLEGVAGAEQVDVADAVPGAGAIAAERGGGHAGDGDLVADAAARRSRRWGR